MAYVKFEKTQLRNHPDFDERWMQDQIAEDPTILGLGDVIVKDKERTPFYIGLAKHGQPCTFMLFRPKKALTGWFRRCPQLLRRLHGMRKLTLLVMVVTAGFQLASAQETGCGLHKRMFAVHTPGKITIDGKLNDWDMSGGITVYVMAARAATLP